MAERPIFLPSCRESRLVEEVYVPLHWHSGFAAIQKEKNIRELHEAARKAGFGPVLEVSSKSDKVEGKHLSAFHLKVQTQDAGRIPLECAFQGSKIFENGGPYRDIFFKEAREAKRDLRVRESGPLLAFDFEGNSFALEPKTFFYDWLYINSIYPHRDWLRKLTVYAGFTDIELNPYRSINCQARSIALFMTLMNRNLLDEAVQSPEDFRRLLLRHDYRAELREMPSKRSNTFIERKSEEDFEVAHPKSQDTLHLFPVQNAAIEHAMNSSLRESHSTHSNMRHSRFKTDFPHSSEDSLPLRKFK